MKTIDDSDSESARNACFNFRGVTFFFGFSDGGLKVEARRAVKNSKYSFLIPNGKMFNQYARKNGVLF